MIPVSGIAIVVVAWVSILFPLTSAVLTIWGIVRLVRKGSRWMFVVGLLMIAVVIVSAEAILSH